MSFERPTLLPIGAIIRAHGVRGQLRVRAFSVESAALQGARRLFVAGAERLVEGRVERVASERGEWLVKLRGVDDRDAAEALQGSQVALPRHELPPLADDQLYVADLIGCALLDGSGAPLGTIAAVENYGAQELLVVDTAAGQALVPFVEPIVLSVDLLERQVVCDPPEGLFDADLIGPRSRPRPPGRRP